MLPRQSVPAGHMLRSSIAAIAHITIAIAASRMRQAMALAKTGRSHCAQYPN